MKKIVTLAGAAVFAWLASPAMAADTVTGEVVDLACYLPHPDMKGASHRKCAETCAKKGMPLGLLTDDKQVYVLLEDHQNPDGYAKAIGAAATTITVEGTKVNQGGMSGIVVESVK